ncbi:MULTISPECIES: flagellar export chaperone FliS [unclassified Acetobacterium]|jgi:flagellar biosynthetic protein FliS|uniref:flagellar export chaperone FliS n=1 Tax=unclassified Acetobacterium TaxID=2638182 RepID=UPI000DBEB9AD|nr:MULTISPECIES: flagellar export chaperone FliS [unclassified Acetobacterium]AWW26372.1 flagellar export chaperone FliS [Acetobacterium sp. KB-1]MDZ5726218.1 flagellar export chaperone FliS [Acetobacterium sp. K1/6]
MQYANAYQESKRYAIESLSKGEVVIKLFEEAEKQVKMGIILIEKDSFAKAYNCIAKAQKIITSLNLSLDMQYPISIELNQMYSFIFEKLGEANSSRDIQLLRSLLTLIVDLKDSFKEAEKISNPSKSRGL